ncbi:hypothetical protein V6N13_115221 [Hibiscus sabdariffa]|uniref:Uncharacterized protein n=1 Tax=Hibiscus sabdariffa TaxID=183260 RepID=A0ABR2CR34_9ROSI
MTQIHVAGSCRIRVARPSLGDQYLSGQEGKIPRLFGLDLDIWRLLFFYPKVKVKVDVAKVAFGLHQRSGETLTATAS